MINDLKLIEDIRILRKGSLILYGAADKGKRLSAILKNMGIQQAYFCDGDSGKWGDYINGVEIISPLQLYRLTKGELQVVVIITTQFVDEIVRSLVKMEIKDIYTIFAVEYAMLLNIGTGFFSSEADEWFRWKKACYGSRAGLRNAVEDLISCTNVLQEENPILVYQSGKVGSVAVWRSILHHKPAAHIHFCTCEGIARMNGNESISNESFQGLYEYFQQKINGRKIKIVTLIRDPIAKMISWFFYSLGVGNWVFKYCYFNYSFDKGLKSLYEVFEHYLMDSINPELEKDICNGFGFDWFDMELKRVFGIDIYQTEFDQNNGYTILRQGDIEVLCMQTEKINQLEAVLGEFVGIPYLQLDRANAGDDSVYKYAYDTFRKNVKVPVSALDFYYKDNPAMKHFYSEDDIQRYRNKWDSIER